MYISLPEAGRTPPPHVKPATSASVEALGVRGVGLGEWDSPEQPTGSTDSHTGYRSCKSIPKLQKKKMGRKGRGRKKPITREGQGETRPPFPNKHVTPEAEATRAKQRKQSQ